MNVKDWILDFLNKERDALVAQIAEYSAISTDNEKVKQFSNDFCQYVNVYKVRKNHGFIRARTAAMLDLVQCTPDFYPGTVKSQKYAENRNLLHRIDDEFAAYMDINFRKHSSKLAKLDEIIDLADQLEHEYCESHYSRSYGDKWA